MVGNGTRLIGMQTIWYAAQKKSPNVVVPVLETFFDLKNIPGSYVLAKAVYPKVTSQNKKKINRFLKSFQDDLKNPTKQRMFPYLDQVAELISTCLKPNRPDKKRAALFSKNSTAQEMKKRACIAMTGETRFHYHQILDLISEEFPELKENLMCRNLYD